ncbi:MAG: cytochrome c oxidase subunit II [Gammaproteobacteria bacterium]|nr:cytochrome c oxidase subunit II [Gammaproteobacteria bacterium]
MSRRPRILSLILAGMLILFTSLSYAGIPLNLPYGVTPISHDVYELHMITFYICVGIGVVTFGALIYILLKFRKSKGAISAGVDEHLGIELVWTIIPFIILVIMAVPATIVLLRIHDTSKPALNIKITGYQWKWKYDYLDQGVSFFSNSSTPLKQINGKEKKDKWFLLEVDHPMVVPINKKVRIFVTSDDVIHSWWVPDLGFKQDAIPGYINTNWLMISKPGMYRGRCAELCGAYHGFMPIVVKAVSQADFKKWLAKQERSHLALQAAAKKTFSEKELLALGKIGYGKHCAVCHQPGGKGLPPNFPALKASPVVTGSLVKQIDLVLNGVNGTAMQAFGNQLDDKTLAAIITYTRHAWGNAAINKHKQNNIVVQPTEVGAQRHRSS